MTANDKFFQEKQAAAVLKHGILQKYLSVFVAKTASSAAGGRVIYLDGFAGPGRYEPEDGQVLGHEGSPLLAMRAAAAVEAFGRTLHCVFIERAPQHFDNLRRVLASEVATKNYETLGGDVSKHLDHVLALAEGQPLLAFLDPFGTGLPYPEMTHRLLRRPARPPTEVLLNFNLQSVWRIGGLLAGDKADAPIAGLDSLVDGDWLPVQGQSGDNGKGVDNPQSAAASLARIDEFLGSEWWREVFMDARMKARVQGERAASARAAQEVVKEYCKRIEADTGYEAFSVPIRRESGQEPLFMMILFYRYPGTPYTFNGAVSTANKEWRQFTNERSLQQQPPLAPEDGVLFENPLTPEMVAARNTQIESELTQDWIDVIVDNITELITTHGQVDVQRHTKALFGTTLGLARETHLRMAWDRLAERGVVLPRLKGKKNKIENQRIRPV